VIYFQSYRSRPESRADVGIASSMTDIRALLEFVKYDQHTQSQTSDVYILYPQTNVNNK